MAEEVEKAVITLQNPTNLDLLKLGSIPSGRQTNEGTIVFFIHNVSFSHSQVAVPVLHQLLHIDIRNPFTGYVKSYS